MSDKNISISKKLENHNKRITNLEERMDRHTYALLEDFRDQLKVFAEWIDTRFDHIENNFKGQKKTYDEWLSDHEDRIRWTELKLRKKKQNI